MQKLTIEPAKSGIVAAKQLYFPCVWSGDHLDFGGCENYNMS